VEHQSSLAVRQRERDKKRLEMGLCRRCSEPLAENSKAFCENHLEMNRKQQKERSEKQKAQGMCKYCTEPLSPHSSVFCEEHRLQTNKRSLSYERAKRAEQMCVDCGERTSLPRKPRCGVCEPKYQALKKTLCQRKGCDKPLGEGLKHYCREHADEANQKLASRRTRLQKENKCYFCQTPLEGAEIGKNSLCAVCRDKSKHTPAASASAEVTI
jgi:hypothetical protein